MKKKLFSMIACIAFVFALLPVTVKAAQMSSVSISGLDYPVAGKTLDKTYIIPSTGITYTKDSTIDVDVTWYDQGTAGIGTTISGEVIEDESYKVQKDHYYMAKLSLCDVRYLADSGSYTYFADQVSVDYEVESRLKSSQVKVANNQSQATVYLFFKADTLYNYASGGVVSISTDKVSDSFDVNTDDDEWNDAFKIAAGTTPWTTADMSWYTEDYNVTLAWYKGVGETKAQMSQSETFIPGEKYTLRVTADSDFAGSNATFDADDEYLDLCINNAVGEVYQKTPMKYVADFVCVAQVAVDEISIEGIRNPEPYADIQDTGFRVTEGISIVDATWYTGYELEVPQKVSGKFAPATDYWLIFELKPNNGYVIDFAMFDDSNISINCGTKCAYNENNDGSIRIGVKFTTAAHTCEYSDTWEKDETNHWKICTCGEKGNLAAHTYDAGKVTKEATYFAQGEKLFTCTVCGATKKETTAIKAAPKKNTKLTDAKTGNKYKITKAGTSGGTVEFTFPKNKKVTKVTIPATVKIDGITYKVTSVAKNACKGCTKLTTVTINKNVSKIGANAFSGCKKLKKITIKTTKLKSSTVGKNAFKGTPKNAKVKVPKKSLKAYKKFLYKKGLHKKAKITK